MRQFNDTANLTGLVQGYEDAIGAQPGDVSGNTIALKKFAARANSALADYWGIALQAEGTWQLDDSNHKQPDGITGNYPIITTNLVAGQRDYSFTTDASGNLILDIYRVMAADASGTFRTLMPVDVQSQNDMDTFYDGRDSAGTPTRYDKTANGIFLDLIPNYAREGGLKVYINREASQFAITDTTKKPGVPGIHHDYFFLKPAAEYARIHAPALFAPLQSRVLEMEQAVRAYFSKRPRDERGRVGVSREDNR